MSLPGKSEIVPAPASFASNASAAEQAVTKDLEHEPNLVPAEESDSDYATIRPRASVASANVSMVGSCGPLNAIGAGSRGLIAPSDAIRSRYPTKAERDEARGEERSSLEDNAIVSPGHREKSDTFRQWCARNLPSVFWRGGMKDSQTVDTDSQHSSRYRPGHADAAETDLLLGNAPRPHPHGGRNGPDNIDKRWEEAVLNGEIQTTWQREAKVLIRYSAPLILTFLLQYSLNIAGIFAVGHIGKIELGAVSLASMTASITGYAVYHGLATSLDTLCAQAYGSGHKKLVGLQTQRMVRQSLRFGIGKLTGLHQIYFLGCITIPIGIVWLSAETLLKRIVPDPQIAILAGRYLRVILIGAPGYACFESGKRYLQAQGLFSASLYVLLICAPLNAVMNWLFVWVLLLHARRFFLHEALRPDH